MTSLNERAWRRLEKVFEDQDLFDISARMMECGTRLIDAGVNAVGGMEAGLAMAEVGMVDLGSAKIEFSTLLGIPWPAVTVSSDHPMEACFLSQAAHWPVQLDGFQAMGSGPACLLNRELDPGRHFAYKEKSDYAVLVLETRQLPDESVCRSLAQICGVNPDRLALVVAPTSSPAGSTQIAARSVETGLHKLHTLGFDLRLVSSAVGRCPIAAPTGDDLTSLGRTNDLVLFASQVWFSVGGVSDQYLEDMIVKLPASTSPSYGPPFMEALKKAGGFYALDPGLFAPSEATLVNQDNGRVFHAGSVDADRLVQALKG